MAKRKVTTIEEDIDEKDTNYQDLHRKDMDEVIRDAHAPVEEPVNPVEEKAKDIKPDEEEVEVELEELDEKKLKDEAAAQAKAEILEALKGKDADSTQQNVDEYDAWAKKVFADTGKPPNWKQAADFIKDITKRDILKEQQEKAEKDEADRKAKKDAEESQAKTINEFIDRELDELYDEGKLPKVVNKDDEHDPGMVARRELFQTMYNVNQKLTAEGKTPEYSVYKVFHKYYKAPSQPPGADAPVMGGNTGVVSNDQSENINYKELKLPWGEFLRRVSGKK